MVHDLMWLWWALTVAICGWKIIEAFVRPAKMLEWPFLASAMWAYFYGYMAYNAKVNLSAYLGNGISNIGQLMPLLCLIGILIGWALGTRDRGTIKPDARTYNYFHFWLAGLFFVFVGAVGGYSVMHAMFSGTLNFQQSSGYWYLLFYVGYPGLAITIWAIFRMPTNHRILFGLITLVAMAAFMFPHVYTARRGPLFPAIMILLLVPPLARRRAPNPLLFFSCLAAAGLVMMLFLQIRHVTYNGGSWGEALQDIQIDSAITDKTQNAEDNEYINNCQLIGTLFQNGKYQYGTGHMELLWQWVPRAIWKDKPSLGQGSYSYDEMFDDIESATGFHLLGAGAASGGVADTFIQYGLLCPFFWLILSWGIGWVYVRARHGDSARWLFCYIGFICATHWLVSQGFAASFVPGMYFQIVPIVVFLALEGMPKQKMIRVKKIRRPAPQTAAHGAVVP